MAYLVGAVNLIGGLIPVMSKWRKTEASSYYVNNWLDYCNLRNANEFQNPSRGSQPKASMGEVGVSLAPRENFA